jgi:hypothetical protein
MTKRKQIAEKVEQQMLDVLSLDNQPTAILWSMYKTLCLPKAKVMLQRQPGCLPEPSERIRRIPPASKPTAEPSELH